jgi:drug/metabolite transporter (DMT)-like permease
MAWFILANISVIFYSFSTIIQRKLMNNIKSDPVASMIVFQFVVTIIIFLYLILSGSPFPDITKVWPFLLLNGFLVAIASVSMFQATKYTEAGEYTILGTFSAFVNLFVVTIFLHETLTVPKIIGTILIILSIIAVGEFSKNKKIIWHKGHLYALLSATAFGAVFASESYVASQIGVLQDLLIGFFLPGLFVLILKPQALNNIKKLINKDYLSKIMSFSVLYLLGAITVFGAYVKGGDAGKIYGISNSTVIVTVILAAIFLGEKDKLIKKVLATISAFAGILLLR